MNVFTVYRDATSAYDPAVDCPCLTDNRKEDAESVADEFFRQVSGVDERKLHEVLHSYQTQKQTILKGWTEHSQRHHFMVHAEDRNSDPSFFPKDSEHHELIADEEAAPLIHEQRSHARDSVFRDFEEAEQNLLHEGNISEVRDARAQEMAQSMPWLNGSRRKLLLIWLPFSALFAMLVVFTTMQLHQVSAIKVKEHSEGLLQAGHAIQFYF